MTERFDLDEQKIQARKAREDMNVFSRLPVVYSTSRAQGQKLLQIGGGLSIVEWRTLWDLAEAGPMTIGDLAEIQRADHSLVSRALPEMRRKGYVSMGRDPRDGRQTIVALTPEGKAAYERAAPVMARRRAALREMFTSDEIANFVGYLDRLEKFMRIPAEDIAKEKETAL